MKCEKCGKKIEYNQYVKHEDKVYCPKCYEEIAAVAAAVRKALKDEIVVKRKARKEKRKRMKKKSEKVESYNPFGHTNGANE